MAVLECPECHGNVSDKADVCPHCGFPVKKIKRIMAEKNVGNSPERKEDTVQTNRIEADNEPQKKPESLQYENITAVNSAESGIADNNSRDYSLWSSFGRTLWWGQKKAQIHINDHQITIEQKNNGNPLDLKDIKEVNISFYLASLNVVALLCILGFCAIGLTVYDFGITLLLIQIAAIAVLLFMGKNRRIELIFGDGRKISIYVFRKKKAEEFLNDLLNRAECSAVRKKKACIRQIIAFVVIILLFGVNIYNNLFSPATVYVADVKASYNNEYPGETYGNAFKNFFSEPKWKGFKSENGDYTVQFTGSCQFDGSTKKVTIQYTMDDEKFTLTYYDVGGKAASEQDYKSLMKAVFKGTDSAQEATSANTQSTQTATTSQNSQTTDTQWKKAYLNYITNTLEPKKYAGYQLINIDDDNIPELVAIGNSEAQGNLICVYHDGNINTTQFKRLGFSFIKKGNLICNSDGNMDAYYDIVYSIKDGVLTKIAEGSYGAENNAKLKMDAKGNPIYVYTWNGATVEKDQYTQNLNAVYDSSKAVTGTNGNDYYTADKMTNMINNY